MGAHLPFRNTYKEGIYPFLGQTRHYKPEENAGLFRWADTFTILTHSLIPLERSHRHSHVVFLSLYILSLPWFCVVVYLFRNFTSLFPAVFGTSQVSTL